MIDNPNWLKERIKKREEEERRIGYNIDFDAWRSEQQSKKDINGTDNEKED